MKFKFTSESFKQKKHDLNRKHDFEDDDEYVWDQMKTLRADADQEPCKKCGWCNPSCIPIAIVFILIGLIVLLPLLEPSTDNLLHVKLNGTNYVCTDKCKIQLVESIPEGLNFSENSPKFLSTYDAWSILLNSTKDSLDIGSFYWTLRGADFYNHSSAWQGEDIFKQIMTNGRKKKYHIRIAQSTPTPNEPNLDTEIFIKKKVAEVRSVNFPRLVGGGVLHTKLWISDGQNFYLGSANMDWRSLTQVKELGVLVTNCTCLAKDVSKIFEAYWYLGVDDSHIPSRWPESYSTKFNIKSPVSVNFNDGLNFNTFFSNSPPPLSSTGRTNDLDAIVNVILSADKFVHIAVMDYYPLLIYSPKIRYWPYIDDALRKAAIENKVSVKMLISLWGSSRPSEDYFLKSLASLTSSFKGVDIEIRRFIVPATPDQAKIPFGRVNHNKYMVTDNTAYIGTSNWSGDYFTDTAGIGLIIKDSNTGSNENDTTIVTQLTSVFERDWNSPYAVEL
ncbi:5'-3' exonuclease PLD3-like [Episyrphus balteatus]|uniref:5'-3' exonuclease PLD3-like n=1 Tax=Episyrphus balteatus TaxID=286459 RepID=UPI002486923A|nr:5'-3' exonuclease PLD3-like [Episyrphus balteatus]XP_055842327.1 5'-3' exonuclease PLD3-like [Episyrphus balteatus]